MTQRITLMRGDKVANTVVLDADTIVCSSRDRAEKLHAAWLKGGKNGSLPKLWTVPDGLTVGPSGGSRGQKLTGGKFEHPVQQPSPVSQSPTVEELLARIEALENALAGPQTSEQPTQRALG